MKAYGSKGNWDLDDYGPPTRISDMRSKARRELRRAFHKQGRNQGKEEISRELKEYYDN